MLGCCHVRHQVFVEVVVTYHRRPGRNILFHQVIDLLVDWVSYRRCLCSVSVVIECGLLLLVDRIMFRQVDCPLVVLVEC